MILFSNTVVQQIGDSHSSTFFVHQYTKTQFLLGKQVKVSSSNEFSHDTWLFLTKPSIMDDFIHIVLQSKKLHDCSVKHFESIYCKHHVADTKVKQEEQSTLSIKFAICNGIFLLLRQNKSALSEAKKSEAKIEESNTTLNITEQKHLQHTYL